MGRRDPTAEQLRNRARLYVVGRVVAGLIAILIAAGVVAGIRDGYLKIGIGDTRGPMRDYVLLDTPLGMMLGSLFLEAFAVFFGLIAIAPRYALRPRFLFATIAVVAVGMLLMGILYR